MKKHRIAVTVLMLIVLACVLFGRTGVSLGGLTFTSRYLDALTAGLNSTWRTSAVFHLWSLVICSIAGIALVWINKNSLGWQYLREAEGSDLPASKESARQMHKKYPLPQDMEDAESYIHGLGWLGEVSL